MAVTLVDLSIGYNTPIHEKLNINFEKGKWHFFIGSTGSGKSTLLQTISKLIQPIKGEVLYLDKNLKERETLLNFRNQYGVIFQYTDKQFFNHTVKDEILFNLKKREKDQKVLDERLGEMLTLLNIKEGLLERSPFELSGGQKRMVALASILITSPSIIFLDEPTVGLDIESKTLFFKIMKELNKRGVTIIQVSHFLEDVLEYGDTVSIFSNGNFKFYPDTEILLNKDAVLEANLEPLEIIYINESFEKYGVKPSAKSVKELVEMLKGAKYEKI